MGLVSLVDFSYYCCRERECIAALLIVVSLYFVLAYHFNILTNKIYIRIVWRHCVVNKWNVFGWTCRSLHEMYSEHQNSPRSNLFTLGSELFLLHLFKVRTFLVFKFKPNREQWHKYTVEELRTFTKNCQKRVSNSNPRWPIFASPISTCNCSAIRHYYYH